jgi:hypothetical protein
MISNAQTVVFQKPRTANTIVCFKEQPEIDGLAYAPSSFGTR